MTEEEAIRRFECQYQSAAAEINSGRVPTQDYSLYVVRKEMARIALQSLKKQQRSQCCPRCGAVMGDKNVEREGR